MPIPLLCLTIMIFLVVLTKAPVGLAMKKADKNGYDNREPRKQQATLTGWGARALAAHQNTFEALTIFTAAVAVAHLGDAPTDRAAALAVTHTVARVLYPIAYIADVHLIRSGLWFIGFGSALGLALSPLF